MNTKVFYKDGGLNNNNSKIRLLFLSIDKWIRMVQMGKSAGVEGFGQMKKYLEMN